MDSTINNIWIQSLKSKYENLKAKGLIEKEVFNCQKCEDKGYTFNNEGEVVWCECKLKKDAEERLSKSGLAHRIRENTFKNYKQDDPQRIEAVNYCLEYLSNFKEFKPSIVLMGEVGAGKTHLAIATANKLLSEYSVKYVPYEDIRDLRLRMNDKEYYNSKINSFREVSVLFIDDLFKGLEKDVDIARFKTELDITYQIINYRYNNKKPMIITTELNVNRMMQIDGALASRILEMSKGYWIKFEGIELNYRIFGN